jgi:hypothetical protein
VSDRGMAARPAGPTPCGRPRRHRAKLDRETSVSQRTYLRRFSSQPNSGQSPSSCAPHTLMGCGTPSMMVVWSMVEAKGSRVIL